MSGSWNEHQEPSSTATSCRTVFPSRTRVWQGCSSITRWSSAPPLAAKILPTPLRLYAFHREGHAFYNIRFFKECPLNLVLNAKYRCVAVQRCTARAGAAQRAVRSRQEAEFAGRLFWEGGLGEAHGWEAQGHLRWALCICVWVSLSLKEL